MKTTFLLISIFLIHISTIAQTIIRGEAPSYKGDVIEFYAAADPITMTEKSLGKTTVADDGSFKLSIKNTETIQAFCNLGVYKGALFLEPNGNYEVSFPVKKEKQEADELNPYFKPTEFYITPLNTDSTELNHLIIKFDGEYNKYVSSNFKLIYMKSYFKTLEENITRIDKSNLSENEYFITYKKFQFGILRHASYIRSIDRMISKYFASNDVAINVPTYNLLFKQVFSNYINHLSKKEFAKRELFPAIVNSQSVSEIKEVLAKNTDVKNDTLSDFVVLKILFDSYFDGTLPKDNCIFLTDVMIRKATTEKAKVAAENMYNIFTKLIAGAEAPLFTLESSNGEKKALSDFRGKFVYLSFCNTTSYACLEQLELLKQKREKYAEVIDFVTISNDDDFETMKQLVAKNGYDWTFLNYENNKNIIDKYDVKVFPTYFLIDPEGKLVMSPAPNPKEDFDARFFNIWNARRIENIRNEGKDKNNNDIKDSKDKR